MEDTKEYVAQLVTSQLGCEGFRLRSDQVLLVSARDALLARLVLAGRAGPEEERRFLRLAFGARAAMRRPAQGLVQQAAWDMLEVRGGVCVVM